MTSGFSAAEILLNRFWGPKRCPPPADSSGQSRHLLSGHAGMQLPGTDIATQLAYTASAVSKASHRGENLFWKIRNLGRLLSLSFCQECPVEVPENFCNQAKCHLRRCNEMPEEQFDLFLKKCAG